LPFLFGEKKERRKFNMVSIYVGNNLRLAREQRGLKQRELAERVHYSASTISDIERGKRKPWPKLGRRLSKVLDVSTSDLFPEGISKGR
jgi:transcriptional regulator with XRE-family HTH domain